MAGRALFPHSTLRQAPAMAGRGSETIEVVAGTLGLELHFG